MYLDGLTDSLDSFSAELIICFSFSNAFSATSYAFLANQIC